MNRIASRDEREITVDNAGDRLAYLVLSFGLLVVVAYRSFVNGEASWDLIGLVLLGGFIGTGYRAQQRVLSRRWAMVVALSVAIALVLAAVMVFAKRG